MPDFIPRRSAELVTFSREFTARAAEFAGALKLPAALIAELEAAQASFADAHQRAVSPGTDSTSAFRAKMEARKALVRVLRSVAGMARAGATDVQRVRMGLKPRRVGKAAPLPRPQAAPVLTVCRVDGRALHLHICDVTGRARPRGATFARVFTFAGESAPDDVERWHFRGLATRRNFSIEFPPQLAPGTRVWVLAQWMNPRGECGPLCAPVYGHLGYGMGRPRGLHRPQSMLPHALPSCPAVPAKQAA